MRSVHLVAGGGGLAWFTQLFPFFEIAASTAQNVSFYRPGMFTAQVADPARGDVALRLGPDAPAALATYGKRMTVYTAGANTGHRNGPQLAKNISAGVSLTAAMAAVQTSQPSLVPVISVAGQGFGAAAGAPAIATVPNANSIAALFRSAAASAGNALEAPGDAALFEAYFKANLSLQKAAGRPTQTQSLLTAKAAANLLGKQLDLAPTAADLVRYGVDDASLNAAGSIGNKGKLLEIAVVLIQAVKAFQQNLTSMVLLPAMNDDPHDAFTNMALLGGTVKSLGAIFNGFLTDTHTIADPLDPTKKLGDNLLFTIGGDLYKEPNNRQGWGDGTPDSSNVFYVFDGSGRLAGGSFGGVRANNSTFSFDPVTGAATANATAADHVAAEPPALAAVLHAVARGDARRVGDFYRGPAYTGLLNRQLANM